METVVIVLTVLLAVLVWDKLAMTADFLFSSGRREERALQWLHLRLRFLKGLAREIARTEAELAEREAEPGP